MLNFFNMVYKIKLIFGNKIRFFSNKLLIIRVFLTFFLNFAPKFLSLMREE